MPTGLSGITAALFTFPVVTLSISTESSSLSLNRCPQPHKCNKQKNGQHIIAANMRQMFSRIDAIFSFYFCAFFGLLDV